MYLVEGTKLHKFNTLSKKTHMIILMDLRGSIKIFKKQLALRHIALWIKTIRYLTFWRRLFCDFLENTLLWNCGDSLPACKTALTLSSHREKTTGPKPKWRTDPVGGDLGPGPLNWNIHPPWIEVKHSSEKYRKAQKRECPKILSTSVVLSQVYLAISLV